MTNITCKVLNPVANGYRTQFFPLIKPQYIFKTLIFH